MNPGRRASAAQPRKHGSPPAGRGPSCGGKPLVARSAARPRGPPRKRRCGRTTSWFASLLSRHPALRRGSHGQPHNYFTCTIRRLAPHPKRVIARLSVVPRFARVKGPPENDLQLRACDRNRCRTNRVLNNSLHRRIEKHHTFLHWWAKWTTQKLRQLHKSGRKLSGQWPGNYRTVH